MGGIIKVFKSILRYQRKSTELEEKSITFTWIEASRNNG